MGQDGLQNTTPSTSTVTAVQAPMPQMSPGEWAQQYVACGWSVLPLHHRLPKLRKAPMGKFVKSGFYDASNKPEEVASWWQQEPLANIGVVTGKVSGLVVIDVDGDPGMATLADWDSKGHKLPSEPLVSTSNRLDRKSYALWFKYPSNVGPAGYIRSSVSSLGPGIDVRADGAYQVAPPSYHMTGSFYQWVMESKELPELPEWLLMMLINDSDPKNKPVRPKRVSEQRPSEDEAEELLWEDSGEREVDADGSQKAKLRRTPWWETAKKALKGRDCYGPLFEQQIIAEEGERWITVQSMVGQAVKILYNNPKVSGTTAKLIYALFVPALQQLDEDYSDWLDVGWTDVCVFLGMDMARAELREKEKGEARAKAVGVVSRLLEGVKEWNPDLTGADALAWLKSHLICSSDKRYYVMQDTGYYHPIPVPKEQLIAKMIKCGVGGDDKVISLFKDKVDKSGNIEKVPIPADYFANYHCNNLDDVIGVVGTPKRKGGWLDDGDNLLKIPLFYRRDDLEPTFNPKVDEWLRQFFGPLYDKGIEWISYALDFESGAIAALSLVGEGNSGKKLFVRGLQETINTRTSARGDEMTGRFQERLMRTGFLVIDEGLPKNQFRAVHNVFRSSVAGDSTQVEAKFKDKVEIYNPLRIVMTANNYEILSGLIGDKNLQKKDLKAIGQRVLHIDIPDSASEWLRQQGDYTLTKGWVASDAGGSSDFVLAKHFLWLYTNREPRSGQRFLVEGNLVQDEMILKHFATKTTTAQRVIYTLCSIIDGQLPGLMDGVVYDKEKKEIWATTGCVVGAYNRDLAKPAHGSLSETDVGKVLRTISLCDTVTTKCGKKARWKQLDWQVMLNEATEHGWPCKKLLELKEGSSAAAEEQPKEKSSLADVLVGFRLGKA